MPNREDLAQVAAMVAAGTVTPVLDRTVSLREVPDAMRALGLGHTRGTVAITL
jgi:NADPH:quinone reductase-like Zn-dependent oxidoreductase